MNEPYKIKKGKYKGYEVLWTDGGQIFPREGWYLMKGTPGGKVRDILYLETAFERLEKPTKTKSK